MHYKTKVFYKGNKYFVPGKECSFRMGIPFNQKVGNESLPRFKCTCYNQSLVCFDDICELCGGYIERNDDYNILI